MIPLKGLHVVMAIFQPDLGCDSNVFLKGLSKCRIFGCNGNLRRWRHPDPPKNWHRTKKSPLWKGRSSFKHPLLCSMLIFQGVTLNPMILWMQKMPQFCTERIAWTQDARMAKSLQLTLRLCAMLDMLKISDKITRWSSEDITRIMQNRRRGHKWNPSWNHLDKW